MATQPIRHTKPVALALVICDSLYRDQSGKRALVGLFSRILARDFPAPHHKMCVFVSLTEVYPGTTFEIDMVNAETDQPVFHAKLPPPPQTFGPSEIVEIDGEFQNLVFPEPGTYYIRFFANDEILIQRPFIVAKAGDQQGMRT